MVSIEMILPIERVIPMVQSAMTAKYEYSPPHSLFSMDLDAIVPVIIGCGEFLG
jgi:hypothetical protein